MKYDFSMFCQWRLSCLGLSRISCDLSGVWVAEPAYSCPAGENSTKALMGGLRMFRSARAMEEVL